MEPDDGWPRRRGRRGAAAGRLTGRPRDNLRSQGLARLGRFRGVSVDHLNFIVSLYAAIGILTVWFCWKYVPETKGKHLEEIEEIFRQRVRDRGKAPTAKPPTAPAPPSAPA